MTSQRHHRGRSRRREAHPADAGYSTIEAVITLPALILMTMLVVQYALLWHGRHVAQAAAQSGLRIARGYDSTATAGRDAATTYLTQVAPTLLTAPSVTATRTATTVTVQVDAGLLTVVPLTRLQVSAKATGTVERFVP